MIDGISFTPIGPAFQRALDAVNVDLFGNSDPLGELNPLIGTVGRFAEGLGFAAAATDDLGDEALEAAPKLADFSEQVESVGTESELFAGLVEIGAQRVSDFADALDGASSVDTFLGAALNLRDAFGDLGDSAGALRNVDISDVASGLADVSDEAAEALRGVLGAAGDVRAAVALAL